MIKLRICRILFNFSSTYSLDLPEGNTLKCQVFHLFLKTIFLKQTQECGNVTINEATFNIPCGMSNVCKGNYCIMGNPPEICLDYLKILVRGTSPHSYCGTTWDPLDNVEVIHQFYSLKNERLLGFRLVFTQFFLKLCAVYFYNGQERNQEATSIFSKSGS